MPDPVAPSSDSELRAHVERVLSAHYELDQEIGRGGMGIVYRARDRRLKRVVAIKILPPELAFRSEIRSRFLREAETAASLGHPNIVPIFSVDEVEGLVFFVMAYVSGDNLAKRLHEHGVLSADEIRRILCEVADALDFAHERGVVHRDIKPDNILIDAESGRPMVTDFGIARAVTEGGDSRLTATGMAIGTPAYMSPEQAAGEREIDGRSDLYSLGVVAYQMLVGEPPFVASSTPAMLVKVISERPTPIEHRRTDLPPDLARAIMMCLEKDPANRFPTASALREALTTGTLPSFGAAPSRAWSEAASVRSPLPPPPAAAAAMPSSLAGFGALSAMDTGTLDYPLGRDGYLGGAVGYRYDNPKVVEFRKKLGPYLFVNAVIVLASIFGDSDFFAITVLWSIYIAYRYARLWSDGYDWRDVFRQPRDKELIDVADEGIESMRAVFDREKRQALRERRREQLQERQAAERRSASSALPRLSLAGTAPPGLESPTLSGYRSPRPTSPVPPLAPAPAPASPPVPVLDASGRERVMRAKADCDEIYRMVDELPRAERERLPADVKTSALALAEKVRQLSLALSDIDRTASSGERGALEAEIAKVEAAANPLEAESETRVRRLVLLKRQRRALAEKVGRREEVASKLETCSIALATMRSHLARMTSPRTHHPQGVDQGLQQVTKLVESAFSLADSVDNAIFAADEVGRMGGEGRAARPPAGR